MRDKTLGLKKIADKMFTCKQYAVNAINNKHYIIGLQDGLERLKTLIPELETEIKEIIKNNP